MRFRFPCPPGHLALLITLGAALAPAAMRVRRA
jgi:hypothetical protein